MFVNTQDELEKLQLKTPFSIDCVCPMCGKAIHKNFRSNTKLNLLCPQCNIRDGKSNRTPEQNAASEAKRKAALIKKYGSLERANEHKQEKYKETCVRKYGVDNVFKDRARIEDSCRRKFGVPHPMQNDVIKTKVRGTMLGKYGGYTLSAAGLREKALATCRQRYGYESAMKNASVKAEVFNTKKSRYGNGAFNNHDKQLFTMQSTYGRSYALQVPEFKDKTKQTCRERYGVDYYCQTPGCRAASSNDSRPNKEFAELLSANGIEYDREFPIGRYSYDFKVGNILIEIDPSPTHNSTWAVFGDPLTRDYHQKKSEAAAENGFRCIHVFDWDDPSIVCQLLRQRKTVYARRCALTKISAPECRGFLNAHHIQGACKGAAVSFGLYDGGELAALMTFGRPRYNKNYEWELLRYCASERIIGGAERLFRHFVDEYAPKSVISYCDLSKFTGEVYQRLGFAESSRKIMPSRHWYNIRTGKHLTNNLVNAKGADALIGTTYGKGAPNDEILRAQGFVEIYDCGQAAYVWHAKMEKGADHD